MARPPRCARTAAGHLYGFLEIFRLVPHATATIGTVATLALALIAGRIGIAIFKRRNVLPEVFYRNRQVLPDIPVDAVRRRPDIFLGRHLQDKGTFFGLLAAELALAMKEPLLSIAGSISIFAGRMYSVGDRNRPGSTATDAAPRTTRLPCVFRLCRRTFRHIRSSAAFKHLQRLRAGFVGLAALSLHAGLLGLVRIIKSGVDQPHPV